MKHPYLDIEIPETFNSIEELRDYYEQIPEENWTTDCFYRSLTRSCCALGHLNYHIDDFDEIYIRFLVNVLKDKSINIVQVNDGKHLRYQQETPKQRVIAFLNDKIKERDETKN